MRVLTLSLFATILSAPAFAADLGTYRPGAAYHSIVAPGADACDSQCSGDAQCRGWNYVQRSPEAPGVCEFLSAVGAPISSPISISGQNMTAAPYSSRLTAGRTNTVRVGAQMPRNTNTRTVGQSRSGRRIVRQAPPQRIAPQTASTGPVQNFSLTQQQNRYRQGLTAAPRPAAPVQQRAPQQAVASQRPVFRQHLDSAVQQPQIQQPRAQQPQKQASRRMTGPRRAPAQPVGQNPATNAPQFQAPQYQPPAPQQPQAPQFSALQTQTAPVQPSFNQESNLRRGSSLPPVGQPVGQPIPPSSAPIQQTAAPAPAQAPIQAPPQRSTPSQRLAQFTAQTRAEGASIPSSGAISLTPEQAKKSLFGSLNDDLPVATSVPSGPVSQQSLDDVLAGGR